MNFNQHSLVNRMNGGVHPQHYCLIFILLPPEIRARIFVFTLLSYDDPTRPYPLTAHYRRPGYKYHQLISTSLLRTCRRIYCEAHDLALAHNEHVFWCTRNPGPPIGGMPVIRDPINIQVANSLRIGLFFKRLTLEQRKAVGTVHIFASVDWFENQFPQVCRAPEVQARRIKMTIRHADWRWYPGAKREGMGLSPTYGQELGLVKGLERAEMNVEAMKVYEEHLLTTANKIFKWRFELPYSRVLTTSGTFPIRKQYESRLNHCLRYNPAVADWSCKTIMGPDSARFTYVIVTIIWKARYRHSI